MIHRQGAETGVKIDDSTAGGGGVGNMHGVLRRKHDFGRFLQATHPQGVGVILGVGNGDFALSVLQDNI